MLHLKSLRELIGLETSPVTHRERWVAGLGGFVAILALFMVSRYFLGDHAALPLVASMGASTVLLFAMPHGPMSQPWPVAGGHLVSALVGVSCAKFLGDPLLAGPVAVGLAILAMHYLRCIHPPGGATALVAVIGGPAIEALGYGFLLTPVALNVLVLLLVAVAFNARFAWRRYPALLQRRRAGPSPGDYGPISHEDFVYALSQIDTYVDVSESELLHIYELATGHRRGGLK